VAECDANVANSLLSPAGSVAPWLPAWPRRTASGKPDFLGSDPLRQRDAATLRRSSAPLGDFPRRLTLGFLYPIHAVLAQRRPGGNHAVTPAAVDAAGASGA